MYFKFKVYQYSLRLSVHIFVTVDLSGSVLEDRYLLVLQVGGPYEVT